MTRPNHAREIRYALVDAFAVCERLELLTGRGSFTRQAGGVIVRCPVHEDRTPSCSVRRGPDGTIAWRCHACGASGDVLTLIAAVRGLSLRQDFREVLRCGAEIAGMWSVVSELSTGVVHEDRPAPPPPPPPEEERTYPPHAEVSAVWAAAVPVTDDAEAALWLAGRGLDPELVAIDELARVIPVGTGLPRWASYQRRPWTETGHRLIVPMRGVDGSIVSVRACRIVDDESPKRLPPGGHKATGLVMACPIGIAMLAGTAAPRELTIVEGEPDYFVWATRKKRTPTATLGIVSGSWSFGMASRVPPGAVVWIRTDHDEAGNRYADELARTLRWRGCFVRRGGRDEKRCA